MKRPILFGEVLFDCFEDGNRILGGAPFNVAWHLCGFGLDPLLISAVGDDDPGKEILEKMQSFGFSTEGIMVVDDKPTGKVMIRHPEEIGSHAFEILDDQAYDNISLEKVKEIIPGKEFSFLYHGSLALRSKRNAESLNYLLNNAKAKTFFDVNLRPPFWNQELIKDIIKDKDLVKLNESEMERLDLLDEKKLDIFPSDILKGLNIGSLILTLGEKGARIYSDDGSITSMSPRKIEGFVDSIGAGDAFCAAFMYGMIQEWPKNTILERALSFASEICKVKGAIFENRDTYDRFLVEWTG